MPQFKSKFALTLEFVNNGEGQDVQQVQNSYVNVFNVVEKTCKWEECGVGIIGNVNRGNSPDNNEKVSYCKINDQSSDWLECPSSTFFMRLCYSSLDRSIQNADDRAARALEFKNDDNFKNDSVTHYFISSPHSYQIGQISQAEDVKKYVHLSLIHI